MHFLLVIMAGDRLSFTVQPKAGRWMKLAYFCNAVYSLTVQPRVGRWSKQPTHPWRLNEVGS